MPVTAERLRVGRRVQPTGTVRVTKRIRTRRVVVDGSVVRRDVRIDRVAVDRFVEAPVPPRREGDVLVISVMAEVPVVVTRLKVVEEIRLVPRSQTSARPQTVVLRSEEPIIERLPPTRERRTGEQQWQRRS